MGPLLGLGSELAITSQPQMANQETRAEAELRASTYRISTSRWMRRGEDGVGGRDGSASAGCDGEGPDGLPEIPWLPTRRRFGSWRSRISL